MTQWAEWTKIGPLLVDTFQELRQTFARHDRRQLIENRSRDLRFLYRSYITRHRELEPFAPAWHEVARTEPFRTIIYTTPPETKISIIDLRQHMEEFPRIVEEWKERANSFLLDLLSQDVNDHANGRRRKGKGKERTPDLSVLERATTIFACKWCSDCLLYPHVLSHRCLNMRRTKIDEQEVEEIEPNALWNEGHDQVSFDTVASEAAITVIRALGEDPSTVTWKQLDQSPKRVECVSCAKERGSCRRLVMTWRQAVSVSLLDLKE